MNLLIESNATRKMDVLARAPRHALMEEHGIERYAPPSFTLDTHGYIQKCGKSVEKIFGYRQHELIWQNISCLFPKFSEVSLLQGGRLNPLLGYLCHCDHDFAAIDKLGNTVICNLNFFLVENNGQKSLRLIVRPVGNPIPNDSELHHEEPAGGFPVLSKE